MSESVEAARIGKALEIAEEWAEFEGAHHRMWVIDQMVRALIPTTYTAWVEALDFEWDVGIAP